MTAKEYMYQPVNIYKQIVVVRERISSLRLSVLPSAIRYDKDPVQTSPTDPMPEYVAKLDELELELMDLVLEYNNVSAEVYETICRLPSMKARLFASAFYLSGRTWPQIEARFHWSRTTTWRLNRTVLSFIDSQKNFANEIE